VARYQSWETFGPDDAENLIEEQCSMEPGIPGSWLQLAIVERGSEILIGDCGIHFLLEDSRQAQFGITRNYSG